MAKKTANLVRRRLVKGRGDIGFLKNLLSKEHVIKKHRLCMAGNGTLYKISGHIIRILTAAR
jgi:NADH:ubiquinone oxidoreductase subunit F (NADH-binding)